jgi:hypothetical protein
VEDWNEEDSDQVQSRVDVSDYKEQESEVSV